MDFEQLAALAPVPWAVIDDEGRHALANDDYCQLVGLDPEQIVGSLAPRLVQADDGLSPIDLEALVAGGEIVEVDAILRGSGSSIHLQIRARSLAVAGARPDGLVIVLTDITTQRLQAQELVRLRDRALRVAAERASFVSSVSHELRTPLHAVLGISEMLSTSSLDPEQSELVTALIREARGLRETVDSLLDHARIEARGISLNLAPVDVDQLVEDVLSRARALPYVGDLDLRGEVDADLGPVMGDGHRLQQILTNLVGNAVKFTDSGGVTVSATPVADRLRLDVTDTGPGIPAQQLPSIFEPYVQVPGRASPVAGSGLGLSIVSGLVELMGGSIEITQSGPEGTQFRIMLPLTVAGEMDSDTARPDHAVERPARILVVEDNATNQLLVQHQLDRLGHTFTIVSTGQEALEVIADPRHGYDLILMDRQLPDIDGLEVTRRIRRMESGTDRHVPIAAATASALPEDRAACQAAGMDDFISKPVSLSDLREVIGHLAVRDGPPPAGPSPDQVNMPAAAGHGSVDTSVLEELVTDIGAREPILGLVDRFIHELDERQNAIDENLRDGATEVLKQLGHTLRSTSAMLGISGLPEICRQLELLPTGSADAPLLADFHESANRARDELRAWIGEPEVTS